MSDVTTRAIIVAFIIIWIAIWFFVKRKFNLSGMSAYVWSVIILVVGGGIIGEIVRWILTGEF